MTNLFSKLRVPAKLAVFGVLGLGLATLASLAVVKRSAAAYPSLVTVVARQGAAGLAHLVPTAKAATACPTNSPGTVTMPPPPFSVPATTSYRLWSRIKAPDSSNNSFLFQLDGGSCYTVGDAAIPSGQWTWVDYQNGASGSKLDFPNLSAGSHQIKLYYREAGVAVDRLLLISDGCVPTGTGSNCATSQSDTTPPTASIVAPSQGATVSGKQVVLSVAASDNVGGTAGVSRVDYYITGGQITDRFIGAATPGVYGWVLPWDSTTVPNGGYGIYAKAYDKASPANVTKTGGLILIVNNVAPTPKVFLPTDDIYSNEFQPTVNFNNYAFLRLSNLATHHRQAYLKFNLTGLAGPVQNAKLKLYCNCNTTDSGQAFVTSSNWTETGLNWSNQPAAGQVLSYPAGQASGGWIEIGLNASLVPNSGSFSVLLQKASPDVLEYSSKEAGFAKTPQLILTTQ